LVLSFHKPRSRTKHISENPCVALPVVSQSGKGAYRTRNAAV